MLVTSYSSAYECRKCAPVPEGGQEAAESNEEIREGAAESGQEGESSRQTYVITPALHLHHSLSHTCQKSLTVAGSPFGRCPVTVNRGPCGSEVPRRV